MAAAMVERLECNVTGRTSDRPEDLRGFQSCGMKTTERDGEDLAELSLREFKRE